MHSKRFVSSSSYISASSWLLNVRQKDAAHDSFQHSKIRSGRHRKTGCYHIFCTIKMDKKSMHSKRFVSSSSYISASSWLLNVRQKDTAHDSFQHSKIRSGRHRKTGCHHSCIRDDQRVSHQTEDLTRSHQRKRKWRV